jgi:hypothetical protein
MSKFEKKGKSNLKGKEGRKMLEGGGGDNLPIP